jgi:hypothetical protein
VNKKESNIMRLKTLAIILSLGMLSGCVSTAIDTAGDAAVSVIKLPFKVVGAVIDGVTGSDKKEEDGGDS